MTITRQAEMKASLFYSPGDLRYESTPIPKLAPGEILIKIETALTCGTDLKCFKRGHPVLLKSFPSPFGHECAGTVVEVGEDVTRFEEGDRVVAANSAPCYRCFYCHKGQHNLCEHLDLLNGAYAEYLKIPSQIAGYNTYLIPEHLSAEKAAFAEPLAIALRGVEACGIGPGDRVAILGLGSIGQLLVRVAKWKGAHVTALGRSELKLAAAAQFGLADDVLNLRGYPDLTELKQDYTPNGYGFDVAIEAVGQPTTWEQAIQLVRKGGKVNLFGGCESGTTVSLDTRRMHYDELTLLSLFHHTPFFFKKAVDLLSTGEIDPTPLITHRLNLSQVQEALTLVEQGKALKVALFP